MATNAYFDIFIICFRMMESSAAVCLNVLTLVCVVKYENLRNPAGVLVVCLAITDTLHGLAVFTLPMRANSRHVCTISLTVEGFSLCAQLMTFILIAMERRNLLLSQLGRSQKWQVWKVILAVIMGWTAIATVLVAYAILTPMVPTEGTCTQPDTFQKSYIILNFIYPILCTIMILGFYAAIAKLVISSSGQVAPDSFQKRQQQRAGLRITKMMALVYGVFSLLYTPMGISFATISKSPPFWQYVLLHLSICLADMNYWINPAIYAWRNKQFRKAFQQLFSGCKCHSTRLDNSVGQSNAPSQQVGLHTVSSTVSARPLTSRALEPRPELIAIDSSFYQEPR